MSDANGRARRCGEVRPFGGRWHRDTGGVWSDGPGLSSERDEGQGRRAVRLPVNFASAADAARDRWSSPFFRWPSLAVVVVGRICPSSRRWPWCASAVVDLGTLRRRSVRSTKPGEPAPVCCRTKVLFAVALARCRRIRFAPRTLLCTFVGLASGRFFLLVCVTVFCHEQASY